MIRDGALTIVRAGPADRAELEPLFEAYRGFYGRDPAPEATRAFLDARLERGDSVVLLARRGEPALGFAQLYPSFSSVRLGRVWILNDLFVDPAARGAGVGRALMERAREHAMETGALGLTLETEKSNAAAASLYRSLGWLREETFDRYELWLG